MGRVPQVNSPSILRIMTFMEEYFQTLPSVWTRVNASQTNFASDRAGLNKVLLDELESMGNVRIFFNHKLTGVDFKRRKAWFVDSNATALKSPVDSRDLELSAGVHRHSLV